MNVVNQYFKNQQSPQKEICQKLREIIVRNFPDILEEMKWGVPTYGGGKTYIVALKNHVNMGFSLKELSKEDQKILDGSGKTMKHMKIYSIDGIDEEKIVGLLKSIFKK